MSQKYKTEFADGTPLLDYRELVPFQGDLKDLNETNYEKLHNSIKKHGFKAPIHVWQHEGKNYILDGHQRKRVLDTEKIEFENTGFEVPVVFIPGKDIKSAKEFLLVLASQYGTVTQEGVDAYIAEAGLDYAETYEATHFDAIPTFGDAEEPDVEEDEPPEVNENDTPISKPGEIYQLGRHRLMCGDSTNLDQVKQLMGGGVANLVFTDPPYMVDYHSPAGLTYKSTKFGGDGGAIFNDDLDEDEALRFYTDVLKCLHEVTTDDCPIYWWYASRNQHINRLAMINAGWFMSQIIIWVKESMIFSIGQDFHRMYEPLMFGWKKGNKHYTNKQIRDFKDTFTLAPSDFAGLLDVWLERRDKTNTYVHPTQKPVSLSTRALRKHSRKGDNVIDLFGGSGSTLMGCEQLERNAFLMELDPKYCDVIRKRYWKWHHEDNDEGWEEGTAPGVVS